MEERRIVWERILEAAMKHHGREKTHGIQKLISDDSGAGAAAVSKWAKHKSKPEGPTIRKLADLYGVSASWLGGEEVGASYGEFGPPDELLRKAADITESIIVKMLPCGTMEQFIEVMRRANALLAEGKSEADVGWQLVDEVDEIKKMGTADSASGARGAKRNDANDD